MFDDVRGSVRRLVDAGYDVAVLSNGEPDLLASIVERAGIEDLLSAVVSADEIRSYKPEPAIYELAAERTGTPTDRIAHAATPWYDVYGAMGAGMQAVWVNRRGRPWDTFDGEPSLIVDSLSALAERFEGEIRGVFGRPPAVVTVAQYQTVPPSTLTSCAETRRPRSLAR